MNTQHAFPAQASPAHQPAAFDVRQLILLWICVALFAVFVANVLAAGV